MPEMYFVVKWPDGEQRRCYSPSLIMRELMTEGASYPVYEFMERSRAGLNIASERVRAKYGFYCTAAMDQLAELEERAQAFASGDMVDVLAFLEKNGTAELT